MTSVYAQDVKHKAWVFSKYTYVKSRLEGPQEPKGGTRDVQSSFTTPAKGLQRPRCVAEALECGHPFFSCARGLRVAQISTTR